MSVFQLVKNFHREESGQDLIEYALVLAAIVTAVLAGSSNLSTMMTTAITDLSAKISTAIGT